MSDRIVGLIVVVLALAFFASASQLDAPFFADPLGPKAFPILISVASAFAGIVLILRPDAEPKWAGLATFLRLAIATLILIFYAYALKPLGFLLPTALSAGALSYQIDRRAVRASVIGISLSIVLFIIFRYALGLSLFALPRWLLQ